MLHAFLSENRTELLDRSLARTAGRSPSTLAVEEATQDIPGFLDRLIAVLRDPDRSANAAVVPVLKGMRSEDITVDLVVHAYGDLCQAIMEVAKEEEKNLAIDEFRVLNGSLDDAIAGAATQCARLSAMAAAERQRLAEVERMGYFAHELRNHLQTATYALATVQSRELEVKGRPGEVLDRSLRRLRNLVARTLEEVRSGAGNAGQRVPFKVASFLDEVKLTAAVEAREHRCELQVTAADPGLCVEADRDMLLAAVGNLLQNAFKFSHGARVVTVEAYASGDRVLVDVADTCGGIPSATMERIFQPFVQADDDRTGVGLGLPLVRRHVESNGGTLSVRNHRSVGCVFSIELPRVPCGSY